MDSYPRSTELLIPVRGSKGKHWGSKSVFSYMDINAFSSVAQSCPTLCDPIDYSTPGLPVHHQLPEFTQIRPLSQWCHPTISFSVPFSSSLQSFPASGSFPVSQIFASGGQSIGVSALASVLAMNIQDWFPSGWTGWISLQSKSPRLSRVFSNTTVQKHQFFGGQVFFIVQHSHPYMTTGKTIALTRRIFVGK